jgi:DNA invertase Pin-like site-specific DNA recombinase
MKAIILGRVSTKEQEEGHWFKKETAEFYREEA